MLVAGNLTELHPQILVDLQFVLYGGVEPSIDVNDIRFTLNGDNVGNTRFSGQISQK